MPLRVALIILASGPPSEEAFWEERGIQVIPRFENRSINMARVEADTQTDILCGLIKD